MALTEQEIQTAIEYIAREMKAAGLNITDVGAVVRWLVENPLPDKAVYEAELNAAMETENTERIALLTKEIQRLQRR